jgi:hypothetical protein
MATKVNCDPQILTLASQQATDRRACLFHERMTGHIKTFTGTPA